MIQFIIGIGIGMYIGTFYDCKPLFLNGIKIIEDAIKNIKK